ncbi:transcription factor TFIIH complex subunit Tfb5-domain-containing protein [Gloeopeniophorella convolvens]|nr:transcription factor TFIIH complex subunit Tfb5-domain-containing protein [Gloeopeniophorella convolvens]
MRAIKGKLTSIFAAPHADQNHKGVLLECDSAVKQILLTLDERPGQSFIVEDLDEFHVVIRADEEQRVRRELEAELEKNTYSMEA